MKKPIVISIAAVSGGGKTTVVNELKIRLPLSKAVFFKLFHVFIRHVFGKM